ncbi:CD3072 family TudS-related putative desulfidase [Clostridium sp.]
MERKKIVFVSHCVLNTASKVVYYNKQDITEEEVDRKNFLCKAIKGDIHFIQLPCPEFNMYGSNRWGHTKDQFDNPFFRDNCRKILEPILLQMKEYISEAEKFEVLGIVGIDGSPSCGVNITCCGDLGGEFSGLDDINEVIDRVHVKSEKGVFMEVLEEMMMVNAIHLPMLGLKGALQIII